MSWDDHREEENVTDVPIRTLSLLIPGLIGVIAAPMSIHGVTKYNFKLNVFSCVVLGLLLLNGIILSLIENDAFYFGICYSVPFLLYSLLFGFTIKGTRKIGHADDVNANCCKGCYDCCECQKGCDVINLYTRFFV